MTESHVAVSATGLLADFNRAGALTWADVHPAQQLGHLFGEKDQRVQLALALTVRALRSGSICVELDRIRELDLGEDEVAIPDDWWPDQPGWEAALQASPAVTAGDGPAGERPLRLVDGALYLERHFADQESVRRALLARLGSAPHTGEPEGQDAAVDLALTSPVTVIAGGPGVGKTYTIRRIIDRLRAEHPDALVALAAPTGKAAARMTESLGDGSLTALTLHALLGKRPGSMTRFRHHADNPLPHDVVVVDEMSMVSMVMMSRLLEALKPSARLVMVGDPDQLSSVDAGSVLADITRAPAAAGIVARLVRNYRFTGAIADLATAIRTGDADAALAVLTGPDPSVRLAGVAEGATSLRERVVASGGRVFEAAAAGRPDGALAALDAHIHDLDYIQWLMGPTQQVQASGWQFPSGTWAHATSWLRCDNGRVAVAEGAVSQHQDAGHASVPQKKSTKKGGEKKRSRRPEDRFSSGKQTIQLAKKLESLTGLESRVTILGYLQRGGTPSAFDRVLATRLVDELRVARQVGMHHLQRDTAVQPEIVSEEDSRHTAVGDLRFDPVPMGEGRSH